MTNKMTDKEMNIDEINAVLCVIINENCTSPYFIGEDDRKFPLPREIRQIVENIIERYYIPLLSSGLYAYGYRRNILAHAINNENEIERIAKAVGIAREELGEVAYEPYRQIFEACVNAGIGDKKQAAKSAVRDFITRLSYVRKSTVDDDGEPIVTVGVVNFDDMVDMFHELYGADE